MPLLLVLLLGACDSRPQLAPEPALPAAVPMRVRWGNPEQVYPLPGETGTVTELTARLRIEQADGQTVVRMPLRQGEALWGFGQRLDVFNLRGSSFEVWAEDSWNRTDTSYFAVPWLVSSEGYGLFINHTGRLQVDLGATEPNELQIVVPGNGVEIWAVTGTPAQCVAGYSALVGRPQAVPEWTFQPWLSRNSFLSAYEVDRTLGKLQRNGLRVGAVVLESWEEHLHNFRFETNRYPHAADWIEKLHQRGVHVICWTTASIWNGDPVTDQARARGFLVRNEDGTDYVTRWLENGRKMDFRQPEARAWWRDLHRPLIALGVDGFKTDGGEHMPDPHFHNVHPFYYQRATLDAFTEAGRTGITFARAANPLCAGNATFWGGDQHADWSNLAAVVRGGLSAAWSGFFYWGHDVGGYTGTPSKELYVRWLQLGAFSPLMQLHGITPREPWNYDQETLDIARSYFKVRERLQPYLVNLAREAREKGTPMWRPLPLAFPDDPDTWSRGDQFMLGPDLMVAPILTEDAERTVYLPAGPWRDLWSRALIPGPTQLTIRAGLHAIPVYAREAAASRWRFLFSGVPHPAESPLALELSGPRDARGMVPTQRYLRAGQPEPLAYTIHNQSPVNVEGSMAPAWPSGFTSEPARASFVAAPGQRAEVHFQLHPSGDLPPGSYELRTTCRVGTLTAKTPTVTLIQPFAWEVAGPFPGGVHQPALRKNEETFNWTSLPPAQFKEDGFVALGELTDKSDDITFFARTTLASPIPRRVRLHTGSGDALTIWVNGDQVLSQAVYRNPDRDEDETEVELQAGANPIVVRNSRTIGQAGFYMRLSEVKK